ncbi:MAG: hypothetical protein RLZZ618_555 [Pseudomonadota bacterium]
MAGTLVHTRDALVPIEKIKVGDWVLSRPLQRGAHAFKRVTKTSSFDAKEVFLVRFHRTGPEDDSMLIEQVVATGNQPFRQGGLGWIRSDLLDFGNSIELLDGSHAEVVCAQPMFATAETGVAWARDAWGVEMNDFSGNLVDLRGGAVHVEFDESCLEEASGNPADWALRATVFEIEVEDFHTLCVGAMGAWVSDAQAQGSQEIST